MHALTRRQRIVAAGVFSVLSAVGLAVRAESPPGDSHAATTRVFSVSRTFNDTPFRYRMKLLSRSSGYRVYRWTYPSPVVTPVRQNNTIPADYYLPDGLSEGGAKRPAVICLHILEGNFELVHMTCAVLASRGVPAVMFKLPYYGERSLPGGRRALAADPELFAEALSQAVQDVRRTIDLLASRPEINAERIGVMGISLGGILAATAAAEDPRVWRAAPILAGGDLLYIIHHAAEARQASRLIRGLPAPQRAELERIIRAVDPLTHAPRLRERAQRGRVLMINAAEDRVIPKPCTEKLAAALGISDRVIWLDGLGHYTAMAALPQALRTTADFFAQDLPPGAKPPAADHASDPLHRVALLMQQTAALLGSQPSPGRCHFADVELSATLPDGKEIGGRLRFLRGSQNRFRFECELPGVAEAVLGQGRYPWMASGEKIVFKGSLDGDAQPGNPLAFADPKQLLKLRALCGALGAMALVPDTLQRWVTVADDTPADGKPAVRIVRQGTPSDHVRLVFHADGTTPASLALEVEGVRAAVAVHAWQLDTVARDVLFEPPDGLPCREVNPKDLYRMFSAMFNFAMEYAE